MQAPPTVFLSYSWDSDEHRGWVASLASRLRKDGVHTILDQWHAVPGDDLPSFMESAIRDNDFVLIVCTPRYKAKSDGRLGGVGYEGDIIAGELLVKRNHRKFIPLLRASEWAQAAPGNLLGKYYLDFRADPYPEPAYESLLRTVHGVPATVPALGPRPVFPGAAASPAASHGATVRLRHIARSLTVAEFHALVEERDFFNANINPGGAGIGHDYHMVHDGRIVFDTVTDLYWKRAASRPLPFQEAVEFVEGLSSRRFSGYTDWRVPTLEEALGLMEPVAVDGYHLNPIFRAPPWIWTADSSGDGVQWCVFFNNGGCAPIFLGPLYHALAVRHAIA